MEELQRIITRKRALLGLPLIEVTSEPFLSDLRHLAICTFMCNLYTLDGPDNTPRFINLEALDKDEALTVQRNKEGEWGKPPARGLGDVLDVKEKETIEITVTSGDLEIAIERKRRRQENSIIIAIHESLESSNYKCTKPGYIRREIAEAIENTKSIWEQNSFKFNLSSKGAMDERERLIFHPAVHKIKADVMSMVSQRDGNEVLKKLAKMDGPKISAKGLRLPKRPTTGGVLWPDPYMEPLDKFKYNDGSYTEFVFEFLRKISDIITCKKDKEEHLKSWIIDGKIEMHNGECFFSDSFSYACFGEGNKKTTRSLEEVLERGENFLKQDDQKRTFYKEMSTEWKREIDKILNSGHIESQERLEEYNDRVKSVGEVCMALHKPTKNRNIRPLITNGEMWGFVFKSKSKAGDPGKEAMFNLVTFKKITGGDVNTMTVEGRTVNWTLYHVWSRGDWNTAKIVSVRKRVWQGEKSWDLDKEQPGVHPITRQILRRPMRRFFLIDDFYHITSSYSGTAIDEALGAYTRKLVDIKRAVNKGQMHGAMTYADMLKDIDELAESLMRPSDFRALSLIEALISSIIE